MDCKLCHKSAQLQESHIIPKFVYNWMKRTGTGRFRQLRFLNKPLQDGIKEYILCENCEKEFGKREDWFKRNIFEKYLTIPSTVFTPDNELTYFTASILWRILIFFKDDGNIYRFKDELDSAESEWRDFLLNGKSLNKFNSIHLVFIPEHIALESGGNNLYSYFHRAVDIEIAESIYKAFIYAKFSRFIIFGVIKGISDKDFSGTNIQNEMNPIKQTMNDPDVVDFIINRSMNVKSYKDLSLAQQQQNDKYFSTRIEKIRGNDYWQILKKDIKNTRA